MSLMRKVMVATTAGLMVTGLLAGAASASTDSPTAVHMAKQKMFTVTGGKVTIILDPAFTAALSEAGATFSVGGSGSMSTDKDTGQPVVTLPILKKPASNIVLNGFSGSSMKLYLGGTILISGNNVTRTGTNPMLEVGSSGGTMLSATFNLGGYGTETVADWGSYPFPKTYNGKTWLMDMGQGVTKQWGILYQGQSRFLDQPGDGPMPNYKPGGPFGSLEVFAKIKPYR